MSRSETTRWQFRELFFFFFGIIYMHGVGRIHEDTQVSTVLLDLGT